MRQRDVVAAEEEQRRGRAISYPGIRGAVLRSTTNCCILLS